MNMADQMQSWFCPFLSLGQISWTAIIPSWPMLYCATTGDVGVVAVSHSFDLSVNSFSRPDFSC